MGDQIATARKEKDMTQQELADQLGVSQRVITYRERKQVAMKPEQLSALADALGVSADFLLSREKRKGRGNGPKGKAKYIFEEVSKLPRGQQEKIFDLLELVKTHTRCAPLSRRCRWVGRSHDVEALRNTMTGAAVWNVAGKGMG